MLRICCSFCIFYRFSSLFVKLFIHLLKVRCVKLNEYEVMSMSFIMILALVMLVSLFAVRWVFFKVLKIAKDKHLVDNPDARKLQKVPVPVVGGLAVFFGVVIGVLVGISMFEVLAYVTEIELKPGFFSALLPVILSMVVMLYAGAMDDILGLTPTSRFVLEILVIMTIMFSTGKCIGSFHGMWGIEDFSWYCAVPLTVFAGVGIINAINMVDGVNGLSSGLCILASLLFGFSFYSAGDIPNALLAFSMAAALMPFLVHNVFGNTSRMFIGDAGTMVMGLLMTWFVLSAVHSGIPLGGGAGGSVIAMVLSFLSVPVADTLRVMFMRILNGRSPFSPDRTHLHHAFIGLGVSPSITALSEVVINILVVLFWWTLVSCGVSPELQLYAVVVASSILVWGSYFFLEHERSSDSRKARWIRNFSPKTHFGSREWWQRISFFLDSPEYSEHERRNLRERLNRKFGNN